MLEDTLKTQLATYLERLTRPVELVAHLDDQETSQQLRDLLDDIQSASPKVTVRMAGEHREARIPSFGVAQAGQPPRVWFAGIPTGHEFTSLVLALLHVGGHPPKVSPEVLEQARALEGPLSFTTYVSLSCQNCPDVVQALNLLAAVNPRIEHTMVDGALFQPEVEVQEILAVPTVMLGERTFGQGRMTLEAILGQLDQGHSARQAQSMNHKEAFDVLVVGGGPAGAAAAIYAARKGIRTGLLAERMGGQLLDTMAIENYIATRHTEGPKLAADLEAHVRDYEVDVMAGARAEKLVQHANGIVLHLEGGGQLSAKSMVLATGARWRQLGVPGESDYRNRGVAYCPHCDGPLFKGKRVAVVGGGNSGVEAAIDLAGIVAHVTLIEFDAALRADEVLQRKLKTLNNVTIITSALTLEVQGDGKRVKTLVYRDRDSGVDHAVDLEGIFVQIGLLPNTEWLQGTLALTARGEIEVDAKGQTSMPGVFAGGDATTVPFKQIVVAAGEGSKAALGAFEHLMRN